MKTFIQFIEEQVFYLVDNQIGFYIETNELKKQLANISKFSTGMYRLRLRRRALWRCVGNGLFVFSVGIVAL